MSGGGGHMFAMIARNKANKALRNSQKNKFKTNQGLYKTGLDEELEFKIVSEEELALIKQQNVDKIKNKNSNSF